jgi:hypothetical protein
MMQPPEICELKVNTSSDNVGTLEQGSQSISGLSWLKTIQEILYMSPYVNSGVFYVKRKDGI